MSPMPDFDEENDENPNPAPLSQTDSNNTTLNSETQAQPQNANSSSDNNVPSSTKTPEEKSDREKTDAESSEEENRDITETDTTNTLENTTQSNLDNLKQINTEEKSDPEKIEVDSVLDIGERDEKSTMQRDSSMDTIADSSAQSNMNNLTHINTENCGIPLPLFTKGYLCLPYLSLPYIDLLSDVNVRGYIVGATNVLFKQKKQLTDVLVEIEGTRIESQDPDLRRQLHLTTEDLRFADFIVKHVSEEKHDVFLDGVGWEGGDEWIRAQFRVYLLCLLRTSMLQG